MIETLLTQVFWWHWIIFGIILVVAEIIVPLFVIIWFGLSAIIVGFIILALDISLMSQFSSWIILSLILLIVWFKFLRDKHSTHSGQSDFRLDTKGIVIETIPHGARGKVRFEAPVLGSSEWHATSDSNLEKGTVIRIEAVNGQLIKVKKD
jgi:membrane protein implicated in regulation of membrane protease activity